jgi:hypothetical protein
VTCEDICQKVGGGVNTMEVLRVVELAMCREGYSWHIERG